MSNDSPSPLTLGDVLYANSKALVQEKEWVALVHSTAAGDQRALHALYDRAHCFVFTLVMRITANRETAEELTLDVFHDVSRSAPDYDAENRTVLGWIMNQARSRAIDRLRFESRKTRSQSVSNLLELAKGYRERATAVRTIAEWDDHTKHRTTLTRIASEYDRIASTFETNHYAGLEPQKDGSTSRSRQSEPNSLPWVVRHFLNRPTDVLRPPASLRARLALRLAKETGKQPVLSAGGKWSEPEWEQVAPGIQCKLLATDTERQRVSMLVRLAPGASYPAHTHAGVEELHLLDGELWIDERKLLPGEYNYGAPGAGDDRVWSETGCTCVLITSTKDILR